LAHVVEKSTLTKEVYMSVSPVGSSTYQSHLQSLSFDLNGMHAKPKAYAKNDGDLLEYIQNILNDSKFQDNPKGYLANWRVERGYTETFRIPEDQARKFFDTHFKF
jgi:hypothetical protein